jgi:hypothetical protein
MGARPRKAWPNPFYVILVLASTAFMITTFGFLIGPYVERQALEGGQPDAGSRLVAAWFDRHGVAALTVEFALMLATGLLAMATDRWFRNRRPARIDPSPIPPSQPGRRPG